MVFRGYLRAQEDVAVHILWFRSTHQYYRTVEYELHRTNGGGDREENIFFQAASMNQHHCLDTGYWCMWQYRQVTLEFNQNLNLHYLHHHWFDGAHTLQFDSTDEYSETTEYEPQQPLEL